MTVKEYKDKLRELHRKIKENPFRKGYERYIAYGKGYYELVYMFAQLFYKLTKDIQRGLIEGNLTEEDKKLAKVADDCLFIHDFYGSINRSENNILAYDSTNSLNKVHEEEELIECCISCIHCYIETGYFNRYPYRSKGQVKWMEWFTDSYKEVS